MENENVQDNKQVEQSTDNTNFDETKKDNLVEENQAVENTENENAESAAQNSDKTEEVKSEKESEPATSEHLSENPEDNKEETAETSVDESAINKIEENLEEKEEKQEEEKPKFEAPVNPEALEKQKEEYANLEKQVLEIESNINENTDFRSLRKNIVTLKEQILSLFLIPIVDKDKLTDKLQEIYEKLADKQAEIKKEINKVFDDNLEKYETLINEKISEAKELTIFKNARKILLSLQKELKSAKLRQGDKDNFFRKIQDIFDEINQKEIAEREEYEMECSNNYLMIKPKVEQITKQVDASEKFNESRKRLIDLQNQIKSLKLKRNNRDELFQIIRECFNNLNERQDKQREEYNSESKENFEKIKPVVEQAVEFASNPSNFATARQSLIDIQKDLKEMTLTKSQRDELFGKIRECFHSLNEQQDENREEFEKEANQNFAKLEIKVNEALMNVEYSNDFRDIREGLLTVQDEIKIMKLKRSQRNELYAKIKTGFEKFDKKREQYSKQKNDEKKRKLNSILENLNLKVTRLSESLEADKLAENDFNQKLEGATEEEKSSIESSLKEIQDKIKDKEDTLEKTNKRINDINEELAKL